MAYTSDYTGLEIDGAVDAASTAVQPLTVSATTTVTTADLTATVNNDYNLDISGLTAARSFILPAGTVGDRIRLSLSVGDASYELNVKGDTGVSINGGTAAALFTCLVDAGEWMELTATSASNWKVTGDGRSNLAWRTQNDESATQSVAADTLTTLAAAIGEWQRGPTQWYASGVFTPKRPGRWIIGASVYLSGTLLTGKSMSGAIYKNDSSTDDSSIALGSIHSGVNNATGSLGMSPSGMMYFNGSTDNARVKVYSTNTNTLATIVGGRYENFWGAWIGD